MAVRTALPEDAEAMARVHVQSWRETYRGVMTDEVLDDPRLLDRRERFWNVALTDVHYERNRVAVAVAGGCVVGIAMSGPASDEARRDEVHLHLLYLLAGFHGSGLGDRLLNAVIERSDDVSLWVADPNPRAQAFYAKQGFAPDGAHKSDDGLSEVRMIRRAPRTK